MCGGFKAAPSRNRGDDQSGVREDASADHLRALPLTSPQPGSPRGKVRARPPDA